MTEKIVAIVIDPVTGEEFDSAYYWETGQTLAQQGYVVKAVADDGSMTKKEQQRLYDYERALFIDCYGRETPFGE